MTPLLPDSILIQEKSRRVLDPLLFEIAQDVQKVCDWIECHRNHMESILQGFDDVSFDRCDFKKRDTHLAAKVVVTRNGRFFIDTKITLFQRKIFIDYDLAQFATVNTMADSISYAARETSQRFSAVMNLFKYLYITNVFKTIYRFEQNRSHFLAQVEDSGLGFCFFKKSTTELPFSFAIMKSGPFYILTKWHIAKGSYKKLRFAVEVNSGAMISYSREDVQDAYKFQRSINEIQYMHYYGKHPYFPFTFSSFSTIRKHNSITRFHVFQEYFLMKSVHYQMQASFPFTYEDKIQIGLDIIEGLHLMHQDFVCHADIKPQNFVLKRVDGKVHAGVIDLGFSYNVKNNDVMKSFVGSFYYKPPEVICHQKFTDPLCYLKRDIFALGITLYELHFGQDPPWFCKLGSMSDIYDPQKMQNYLSSMAYHTQMCHVVNESPFVRLIFQMMQYDPVFRPTIEELLISWRSLT